MRILFLAAAESIHSYRWVKYFADRGHDAYWMSLTPLTSGEPIAAVKMWIAPQQSKVRGVITAVLHARQLLKQFDFDLIHCHYAGTYGLIGALTQTHKMVLTAWGSDILISRYSVVKKPLLKF